jgi:hypothetical protein
MRRSIDPRRCTLLVVLAAAGGCSLEGNSLPDEYLGQWYYTGSSGGIAGDGMGDEPSGWIVINADNTIDRFDDDGTLLGTDAFEPSLGTSIYSGEDAWILERSGGPPQVIMSSEGLMSLSDNVYDGFSLGYARER